MAHVMAKTHQGRDVKTRSVWNDSVWLSRRDLSRYRGKWIVVLKRKVVAADKDLDKAIRKAKLPPDVLPFLHRVPREETLLIL